MKVSILGLGWFGAPLAQKLRNVHTVAGTTRSLEKASALGAEGIEVHLLESSKTPSRELLRADVVVINIPPQEGQLEWFKSWSWDRKVHVIFISSISVYGDHQQTVDESVEPEPESANGKILLAEEEWFKTFPSSTVIRFGGLIGGNRHPGKILSGRRELKGGKQPVNLVHLDDTIGFTQLVIEKKIPGTFNLVHPSHPPRQDYYQSYCRKMNLPLPCFNEDSSIEGKLVKSRYVPNLYEFKTPL